MKKRFLKVIFTIHYFISYYDLRLIVPSKRQQFVFWQIEIKKKKNPIFLAAENINTISTSFKQEKDYSFLHEDSSPTKF